MVKRDEREIFSLLKDISKHQRSIYIQRAEILGGRREDFAVYYMDIYICVHYITIVYYSQPHTHEGGKENTCTVKCVIVYVPVYSAVEISLS